MRPTSLFQGILLGALIALAACSTGSDEPAAEGASALDEGRGKPKPVVEPAATTTHVRVVASNLTSGDEQSYDPGEGIRILQALKPDVALVQEFNYGSNSNEDLRNFVDRAFGADFSYTREPGGQIPNGVVTRFPIAASGVWNDPRTASREFSWARIDIPGDRDLWAVSVHLLTTGGGDRQVQATALVNMVRSQIPESDYVVLGGDFNTGSRGETCLRTLGALFRTTAPWPVDNTGEGDTNASRREPYDWVIADRELDPLEVPVVVGAASFPTGLVFDSRVFRPLADVAPVQSNDSGATNMQHMAVVRDFAIPAPTPVRPAAPTP